MWMRILPPEENRSPALQQPQKQRRAEPQREQPYYSQS